MYESLIAAAGCFGGAQLRDAVVPSAPHRVRHSSARVASARPSANDQPSHYQRQKPCLHAPHLCISSLLQHIRIYILTFKMVLKRKRSEEAFTSPMSSTSSLSSRASQSPSPQYGHAKPTDNLMDFEFTFSSIPSPWSRPVQPFGRLENQSGRTCKRFRDDRPDERAIHRSYSLCSP